MMTEKILKKYYSSREKTYFELATTCGSVSELLFKIEVYGSKWTKWDWIMFFSFLDYNMSASDKKSQMRHLRFLRMTSEEEDAAKGLLYDIFETIDSGDELDAVFTNKAVVMNFISWLDGGRTPFYGASRGIYVLLAHIFRKFPSMWSMNWMFVRHLKTGARTHRLAFTLPEMKEREQHYFESPAFLDDFVYKYWRLGYAYV